MSEEREGRVGGWKCVRGQGEGLQPPFSLWSGARVILGDKACWLRSCVDVGLSTLLPAEAATCSLNSRGICISQEDLGSQTGDLPANQSLWGSIGP